MKLWLYSAVVAAVLLCLIVMGWYVSLPTVVYDEHLMGRDLIIQLPERIRSNEIVAARLYGPPFRQQLESRLTKEGYGEVVAAMTESLVSANDIDMASGELCIFVTYPCYSVRTISIADFAIHFDTDGDGPEYIRVVEANEAVFRIIREAIESSLLEPLEE